MVQPFASLVDLGKPTMTRVLVNKEKVGKNKLGGFGFDFSSPFSDGVLRDVFLQGDADTTIVQITKSAGWHFPSTRL